MEKNTVCLYLQPELTQVLLTFLAQSQGVGEEPGLQSK